MFFLSCLYRVGLVGNHGHFGQKMLFIIFVVRYDLKLLLLNKLLAKKTKNTDLNSKIFIFLKSYISIFYYL